MICRNDNEYSAGHVYSPQFHDDDDTLSPPDTDSCNLIIKVFTEHTLFMHNNSNLVPPVAPTARC